MRKLLMMILLLPLLAVSASALDLEAPVPPETAMEFMPTARDSFGQGLAEMFRDVVLHLDPALKEAVTACVGVVAAVMIISLVKTFPGISSDAADLAGAAAIGTMLLGGANSLIHLASDTVVQISEYGKLLLPVMTAAMAAQGGVTAAGAVYAGTAAFDALLSSLMGKLLTPMVYLFLALAICTGAVGDEMLRKLRDQMKSFMTWLLKTLLYVYTGYITITGVVSGTTDAAALKAAKLTISGVVPVVGGILSDASEAVLVTAGTVKNAVGIYGLFAILAIWLGPFLEIGVHYLVLKAVAMACGVFGSKRHTDLIQDFSAAMGLLLAMIGAQCLMLLISVVCFMKGVA